MKSQIIEKFFSRLLYPIRPYWTSSVYGFGKWIRIYAYYPPFLPLCIYTDHSPGERQGQPFPHELDSDAPVQFYHAESAAIKWRKVSAKPCHILYSPFVFARRYLKIKKCAAAKGTIFFPAHTTPSIEDNKSIDAYCDELDALPEKYHPVSVCLHIHDLRKSSGDGYRRRGYKVVSAGDSLNQSFITNFYKLLAQHDFAISNIFGSYALYATEMGIPFGIYGAPPDYFNHSDLNVESGSYTSYSQGNYYETAQLLFSGLPLDSVSNEQYEFAEKYLGLRAGISRGKMSVVVYGALISWVTMLFVDFFKKIKRRNWLS